MMLVPMPIPQLNRRMRHMTKLDAHLQKASAKLENKIATQQYRLKGRQIDSEDLVMKTRFQLIAVF